MERNDRRYLSSRSRRLGGKELAGSSGIPRSVWIIAQSRDSLLTSKEMFASNSESGQLPRFGLAWQVRQTSRVRHHFRDDALGLLKLHVALIWIFI